MTNQSHYFNLQMFAGEEGSQPAETDLAGILSQIDESPVGFDDNFQEGDSSPTETPEVKDEPTGNEGDIDEGEYDEIVYNKEKVKIPVSERQTYLQKGYNYDKIHSRATALETRQQEIDAWVKANYGEHGINTWDEWQSALAIEKRKEQLEEAGIDEEEYTNLLQNDPELIRLRTEAEALKRHAEEHAISQRMGQEVEALNQAYGLDLKKIDDVLTLPNAERIIEVARTTGLPLVDAYLLANRDEIMQSKAKAAEQRVRSQVAGKSHIKDTSKPSESIDLVTVPDDVYRMYKELMPDLTRRQIADHYAKSLKE